MCAKQKRGLNHVMSTAPPPPPPPSPSQPSLLSSPLNIYTHSPPNKECILVAECHHLVHKVSKCIVVFFPRINTSTAQIKGLHDIITITLGTHTLYNVWCLWYGYLLVTI